MDLQLLLQLVYPRSHRPSPPLIKRNHKLHPAHQRRNLAVLAYLIIGVALLCLFVGYKLGHK